MALEGAHVQICTCEHRRLFGLSWAKNTSEGCTDPTAASGGDSHCPAQAHRRRLRLSLPVPAGPCRCSAAAEAFTHCPVLTLCLLPGEGLIWGSERKKLACASRARLSLQDGFCLKSLTSSRSAQLMFPNSRSQCFPWTKDKVRQSLLQISASLSYHEGV